MQERGTFERELGDLAQRTRPHRFDRRVAAFAQVERVGRYSLRSTGGAAIRFCSIGTVPQVATGAGYAIFDVLVELSPDPVDTAAIAAPQLPAQVTGAAPDRQADLLMVGWQARFAFAVAPNQGTTFRGTLRLTITKPGGDLIIDLPVAGTAGSRVDDLFVFAVVHKSVKRQYGWTRLRVVEAATPVHQVPRSALAWVAARRHRPQRRRHAQLVAAIVEAVDGPQSDLDAITLSGKLKSGGVHLLVR